MSEDPATIYFTGTAGAGKTSLVRAFAGWMQSAGYDAVTVNLDPGNESPGFEPDVDIRDWVRLPDVMEEYGLGPNGAQVAAADMIALKVFDVRQALEAFRTDYVLVDTPGQVELFAFREASKAIVEALGGERSLLAFLFDPSLAKSASGFVSLLLLSANVEFRFRLPTLNLVTKCDLLPPERLEEILAWGEDPLRLSDAVAAEAPTPEVQLATQLLRGVESLSPLTSVLPTSAKDGSGLEPLYRALQQSLGMAEDLEPAQGPPEP
jgi:GPN-loop GTPase